MILIEFGESKELFIADVWNVNEAIKELYQYVKGGIDEDLFCAAVDGLRSESTEKMVRFYNALACETPIHQIFTEATLYWRNDNESNA